MAEVQTHFAVHELEEVPGSEHWAFCVERIRTYRDSRSGFLAWFHVSADSEPEAKLAARHEILNSSDPFLAELRAWWWAGAKRPEGV